MTKLGNLLQAALYRSSRPIIKDFHLNQNKTVMANFIKFLKENYIGVIIMAIVVWGSIFGVYSLLGPKKREIPKSTKAFILNAASSNANYAYKLMIVEKNDTSVYIGYAYLVEPPKVDSSVIYLKIYNRKTKDLVFSYIK